jgi:hypothetical protein
VLAFRSCCLGLELGGVRVAAGATAAGLLDNVGDLMREQLVAIGRARREASGGKADLMPARERLGAQRSGSPGAGGVGVESDVTQVGAEPLFHRRTERSAEQMSAAGKHATDGLIAHGRLQTLDPAGSVRRRRG